MDRWVYPSDIRGWLTEAEARALAALARGKRVCEIGSYCGKSAISMAQTALHVTCIDPFDARATPDHGDDTLPELLAHTTRYGVAEKVTPLRGTSAEIAPTMPAESFDLVFVDGAHDYDSVLADARAAARLLAPGGLLAFHDYRSPIDPDVTRAVDAYLSEGATLVDLCGTVAIVRPLPRLPEGAARVPRKVERVKPVVFLGMPSYDGKVSVGAAESYFLTPTNGACVVVRCRANSSFLTKTFNDLWCGALNARKQGVTHFAMIHADILPASQGWLDVLLAELTRLGADVVSAIAPIKTEHGWTSTAIAVDGTDADPWVRRRLTMREVYALPETFGAADVGGPLLLNTGLWVCDLRRDWCEQVCFDVFNRICRSAAGEWHAEAIPEDWLFSQALNRLGCSLYATRRVTLGHDGAKVFTSDHAWGTDATDVVYEAIAAKRERYSHGKDQVCEAPSGAGNDRHSQAEQPASACGS